MLNQAAEIIEIDEGSEYAPQINQWSCGLWWDDFAEAGITHCWVVVQGNTPVAFQSVNSDGLCVAIEVCPEHQNQGIASMLVEVSGCWRPERDENPQFWTKIAEKFGW